MSKNNGKVSAVMKCDSETNTTVGYILFGPRIFADEALAAITSHFVSFIHPYSSSPRLQLTATELSRKIALVHLELAKLEQDTGLGH